MSQYKSQPIPKGWLSYAEIIERTKVPFLRLRFAYEFHQKKFKKETKLFRLTTPMGMPTNTRYFSPTGIDILLNIEKEMPSRY